MTGKRAKEPLLILLTYSVEDLDWQAGHGAIVHVILKLFGLNNGGKSHWVEESRWDLRCVGVMG